MIRFEGVAVRFGPVSALRPLDWQLPRGRTTALIGPSGCGKSTLLRLVVGLVAPSSGTLEFDAPLDCGGDWLARRRRIGFVIQDGGLFPHLTAADNVLLMGRELRHSEAALSARLGELARLVRLPEDLLCRRPGDLSGGQRQRVSLMRALLLDPDLLLLDEPLAALDPWVRSALQADLKAIFLALGKTVLLVTHDLAEAAWLAERILLLRDGAIVQEGTLSDLRDRPADPWVTEFLNSQRSLVIL